MKEYVFTFLFVCHSEIHSLKYHQGGKSFVKKSIYGVFNTASKVVGSIGTGVAMISFDDEYQRQRNEAKRREVPSNALLGFGVGLKEFGTGLLKGVSGIVVRF